MNGLIRGQVNGTLEGNFSGFVRGDMSVTLITGGAESVSDEEDPGPDAVEVSAIEEKNPPGLPQKDDRTNDHAKSEEQNKEEKGSAEDEAVYEKNISRLPDNCTDPSFFADILKCACRNN